MSKFGMRAVFFAAAVCAGAAFGGDVSLDGAWQFRRAGEAVWREVTVPHDWAIAGPFDPDVDGATGKLPWRGKGEYRRTFALGAAERALLAGGGRAYLVFGGVMARPRVKVNGRVAGFWDYGYMSFTVDATKFLNPAGENRIEVLADTTDHQSRWYPGAGIYRGVTLKVRPAEHVAPGTLAIAAELASPTAAIVRVACEIVGRGPTNWSFAVRNPKLWDVDSPNLQTLEICGETFRYGIRDARFTAEDGFHLNGRRVQLRGVCLHSDFGPLGMAFSLAAAKRQLRALRDMGANAIRTSHNPPAPELLDLCDEMGFVVWDECFDKWDGTSGRRGDENLEAYVARNLRAFVRRDRNHPSVVAWSIGNEIPAATTNYPAGVTRERCRLFREVVLDEDATRPVAIGAWEAPTAGCFLDLDLTGWNYARRYMPMKRLAPEKPMVYSESCSSFSNAGFYQLPPASGRADYDVAARSTDGYDLTAAWYSDVPDVEFHRMEKDRWIAGEFVWTGADYLGEPSPIANGGWDKYLKGAQLPNRELARSSYYGILDLTGTPKDRFFLYRAHWNGRAETVHVLPHWNWAKRGVRTLPVYVYTSGDEAELFVNGRSQGRRRKLADLPDYPLEHDTFWNDAHGDFRTNGYYRICDKYRLRWFDVPWEPGELKAVAYRGGKPVGTNVVLTAGRPDRVRLTADPYADPADGLAFVQVEAVDVRGVRDPWANARIAFSVSGPGELVAVGNADPRGFDSFGGETHPLYYGRALAVVRRRPGTRAPVVLEARAEGLRTGVLGLGL